MSFDLVDTSEFLCEKNIRLISSLFNKFAAGDIADQVAYVVYENVVESPHTSRIKALKKVFRLSFLHIAELHLKRGLMLPGMSPSLSKSQSKALMAELDKAFVNDRDNYKQAQIVTVLVLMEYDIL